MKKLPQHLEDSILDYLDGRFDPVKKESFEHILKQDRLLQDRLEEIRRADHTLRQLSVEPPSKNFTAIVMGKLDHYPFRSGLSIRKGILLLVGIISLIAIAVLLLSAGVFDQGAKFDLNNIGLDNNVGLASKYLKQTLPSIPVDGKLIVNTIVLLNIALVFAVLDRAILRPLFQRRTQTGH